MKKLIPNRKSDTHKGDYGRLGVIAGSRGMTGAPYLVCESALRTGTGLVYNIVPETLEVIMSIKLTEAIIKPIVDDGKGNFTNESTAQILNEIKDMDTIALGPGIGISSQRIKLVEDIIIRTNIPMVIDADGLNCVAKDMDLFTQKDTSTIITPHPGEMARLLDLEIQEIEDKRQYYTQYISEKYNLITVLKGHKTVVGDPSGEIYINNTGNPGMATAGSGDVLTGIIASLLGQRFKPFEAARLGVYIHGLAGDIAMDRVGEYGLIANDIIDEIPYAIQNLG